MTFRPIREMDRAWIERCRDWHVHPFTALSFPSLYTWREAYGLTVAGTDDAFIVHSDHDDGYFCPCGDLAACQALLAALPHPLHLLYLTREQADTMECVVRERADLSEYLASTFALALRKGHASNSYKMKCRHYIREHPYETRVLRSGDGLTMRMLAERMAAETDVGDRTVLEAAVAGFIPLGIQGVMLRTETGKEGFIFGYENNPEMFTMTMAKHDPELPLETTAVLVYELARMLCERYPLINLEEDLGIEGLRRAKNLYSPVGQLMVYEAYLA